MPLPSTVSDFVAFLDQSFPLKNPTPNDSTQDIMFRAGQRNVVEFIKLRQAGDDQRAARKSTGVSITLSPPK